MEIQAKGRSWERWVGDKRAMESGESRQRQVSGALIAQFAAPGMRVATYFPLLYAFMRIEIIQLHS